MLNRGFTLIELLVTISVVSVGIVGALIAIQQGIVAIDYAKNRLTAALLAQEGVEILKNIRDTNLLEYSYVSASTPWNEGLSVGEYEAEYSDVMGPDPNLVQPSCSPSCGFDDSQLRFLKFSEIQGYNYSIGEDTGFKRKINITQVGSDQYDVDVVVYWRKRGGGNYEIVLKQYLYEWW